MGERRENSVLTSLRDLRRIEDQRLKQEADEEKARIEAARRAREDQERQAREEAERKVREEQDRLSRERAERERAEREARLRLEEAERKARIEAEMQLQQERMRLEIQAGPRGVPWGVVGPIIGVVVIGAGVFGFMAFQNKKASEEQARQAAQIAAQQQREIARLREEQRRSEEKLNRLTGQLAAAQTEAERAEIQRQIDDERQQQQARRGTRPAAGASPSRSEEKVADPRRKKGDIKVGDSDDPLDGLLK